MRRRDFLHATAGAFVPAVLSKPALAAAPAAQIARRPFRLGVTRWPSDLTAEAVAMADSFIASDCDMAAPMLLSGVPWTEALSGAEFSADVRRELAYRPPAGHKLLVSIGALDLARDNLAPYWGEKDNMPLPAPFRDLPFDAPQIREAYSNFAIRVARAMRPDWLVIGIESNVVLSNNPKAWTAYQTLHRHVYERVKAQFPKLKVCFTIEALHYLGHAKGSDAALQRREVPGLLAYSDLVAFSVYPHMSWSIPRPLPDNFYDFGRELSALAGGKPIAIAESGYTSEDVWIGIIPLFGSPENQARHMKLMLDAAQRDRFEFVVNYAATDYERMIKRLPGEVATLAKVWMYSGLQSSGAKPKPALEIWRTALARPHAKS